MQAMSKHLGSKEVNSREDTFSPKENFFKMKSMAQ